MNTMGKPQKMPTMCFQDGFLEIYHGFTSFNNIVYFIVMCFQDDLPHISIYFIDFRAFRGTLNVRFAIASYRGFAWGVDLVEAEEQRLLDAGRMELEIREVRKMGIFHPWTNNSG